MNSCLNERNIEMKYYPIVEFKMVLIQPVKHFREKDIIVPLRGVVKDIGSSSHKSKIVELYLKGYTPTKIQRLTRHSLQSIERYIKDFSRVSILTKREESLDISD